MQIIAIVVTFNSQETIEECLNSLLPQVDRVIVVDNASTDSTMEKIHKQFKSVEAMQVRQNLGYTGGNNIGFRKALNRGAEYVFILNPDTIVSKNCVRQLLLHAETHVETQILGPKIYKDKSKRELWSAGGMLDPKRYTAKLVGFEENDSTELDKKTQVEFISGTCMWIPRKILERGVRFFEPYFLYYEDVEFCVRAKKLGFPSLVVPEAKIIHFEFSSQTHSKISNRKGAKLIHPEGGTRLHAKNYYLTRNHLLFVERNAPLTIKWREIVRLPKTVYEYAVKADSVSLAGIRDYFLRKFGSYGKETSESWKKI